MRGKSCYHLETQEANREAEAHFDRSIAQDPRFALAYAWKACAIGQALRHEFVPRTRECQQRVIQLVEQAMSIDENNAECHRILCRLALIQGQFAKSDHHLECALALNPNDPRLVVQRGINLTHWGDPEAAIPWMAGRLAEATALLERTARAQWEHCVCLATCYAATDKASAAKQAGREAMRLRPNLSIATYLDGWFIWKRDEDRARLRHALAQTGLPP